MENNKQKPFSNNKKQQLQQKRQFKKKQRQAASEKILKVSDQKEVIQMIHLQTIPKQQYSGQSVHISTCGSKPVKSYVQKILSLFSTNSQINIFAYDKATPKLITTIQLVKKQILGLKQSTRIYKQNQKNKLEVLLKKQQTIVIN